jgi:hypothetical protein
MRILTRRWLYVAGASTALCAHEVAQAQSMFDTNVRAAPQLVQYRLAAPVGETISELTTPIFVVIPVSSLLDLDVGTAYAWARVSPNSGSTERPSTISGLTDTQLRANLTLGSGFVVLTAGLNLPTGPETVSPAAQSAAFRIGNDFLAFPISNMGTGFGATGGVAVARPVGAWDIGFGGSMRQSGSYQPFVDDAGARPRFQPGNEYRARLGVDRPFGTGRFAVGLTYSAFGNDDIGGSIYNTGDRYIAQIGFTNTIGGANVLVNAWNLYRRSGTIFSGEHTGPEDVANLLIGVGVGALHGVVEPTLELRSWRQENLDASTLATLGLRYDVNARGFAVTPSAGYALGRFATAAGAASLSGFRAALAVRLGS